MAKKAEVKRTRMTDEQADHFAKQHEKTHDLKGSEAAHFWRRYGARRLAALARDQKKNEKPKAKAKGKAKKGAHKKAA